MVFPPPHYGTCHAGLSREGFSLSALVGWRRIALRARNQLHYQCEKSSTGSLELKYIKNGGTNAIYKYRYTYVLALQPAVELCFYVYLVHEKAKSLEHICIHTSLFEGYSASDFLYLCTYYMCMILRSMCV